MAKKYKLEKLSINSFYIGKQSRRNSGQMSLRGFESGTGTDSIPSLPFNHHNIHQSKDSIQNPLNPHILDGDFNQWMNDHPLYNPDAIPQLNLNLVIPKNPDGSFIIYPPSNEVNEVAAPDTTQPAQNPCPPDDLFGGPGGPVGPGGTGAGLGGVEGDVDWGNFPEDGDDPFSDMCESVYYACPTDGCLDNYDPDSWVLCDSDFCEDPIEEPFEDPIPDPDPVPDPDPSQYNQIS
ncbi:MAG: hypothetical protein WAQ28_08940 [Bacteroidia bacterium]